MMAQRRLYLEQRIAIVRKRLNEETLDFEDNLPPDLKAKFHQFVIDNLNVLDGLDWGVSKDERRIFGVKR